MTAGTPEPGPLIPKGHGEIEDAPDGPHLTQLASMLSELARSFEAEDNTDTLLDDLVSAAVAQIPGVDEGSISVVLQRRDVTSQSPSGELPKRVDALQAETGQGPCLEAVFTEKTVRVPDMRQERRWPKFASRAADAGAASMLSFQLWVEGDNLGALNLYGRQPYAFDDESEQVGLLFVSHAAVALAGAQKRGPSACCHLHPRSHRSGEGHLDGAIQDRRSAGVHAPVAGQPAEQPQASRCRRGTGVDR